MNPRLMPMMNAGQGMSDLTSTPAPQYPVMYADGGMVGSTLPTGIMGSTLPPLNPFENPYQMQNLSTLQPPQYQMPQFQAPQPAAQQATYQYPAYGGMPQDVFDWTAPRIAQGQLIQPPRQAPAQFEAPLYTAPAMPGFGTQAPVTGRPYAATPIAPSPVVPGPGIVTPPPVTPTPPTPDTVVPPVDPSAAYRSQITGIYGDILNRTPDPTGLDYWTLMANQGMSMDDIRRNIQLNENQQIAQIYKDVLGRDTPDAEGLAYWANSGQDMDTIRRNIQLNKEQQGIAALPAAQGPTVAAPVIAPVVAPPTPQPYFQTTNYESGEGYWIGVPDSGNSWYNSGDSAGDVGANPGPDAAADAAASAASDAAASNDGPGDAGNGDGDGNT